MEWNFELLAGPYGSTTEGPAWDGQALLFTHISESRIMRYDPATDQVTEYRTGTDHANGLNFDADGRLYGCCSGGRSIVRFEPDGSTTTIVDRFEGHRFNTPNDLALDSQGRIWFTNPWNESNIDPSERMDVDHEEAFRADPQPDGSWSVTRATFDTTKTNGILVSADERTLYVAQSHSEEGWIRELRAYPINDDGSLDQYVVLHQFGEDHRGPQPAVSTGCASIRRATSSPPPAGSVAARAPWSTCSRPRAASWRLPPCHLVQVSPQTAPLVTLIYAPSTSPTAQATYIEFATPAAKDGCCGRRRGKQLDILNIWSQP